MDGGFPALEAALDELVRTVPEPEDDGLPYLPGGPGRSTGPVSARSWTGTLRRGALCVGDEVEVWPGGERAEIRSLESHGQPLARATPGRRVAASLRKADPERLKRGAALAGRGLLSSGDWLDVELEVSPGSPRPVASGERFRFLSGALECAARLRLLDRDELAAGERALCQLHCDRAVAVPARDPFVLRVESPAATIAGRPHPAASARSGDGAGMVAVLAELAGLAGSDRPAYLRARVRQAGARGIPVEDLVRTLGTGPERIRAELRALGACELRSGFADPEVIAALGRAVVDALAAYHLRHPLGARYACGGPRADRRPAGWTS